MLALGRNPDGTFGSGSEGLIYVDGETVAYTDGVAFSTELTGEEFVEAVRKKAGGHDAPAPDLTHGSPPPPAPSGAPLAALKFRDVNYVASEGAQLPLGEGAVFVINGTEINVDDLELVGSTDESNTGYPGATGAGLMIYRLKDGETNHVYEFRPGKDRVNPEDSQIFKGRDSWTRWTPRDDSADLSREQASRQEVDRNDSPTPDLTHGSPPPPPIAPVVKVTSTAH